MTGLFYCYGSGMILLWYWYIFIRLLYGWYTAHVRLKYGEDFVYFDKYLYVWSMRTILNNGHKIEIKNNSLTGKETIFYNGKIVSKKSTLTGTVHVFNVTEDGQEVQYEVEIGGKTFRTWAIVRRNGMVIFSDK